MTQWHPIFAELLRSTVEAYYEMQTTMPVGDAPREADFVLLRRTTRGTPPFRGLWRHLTTWNILEFKGPTVSPRQGDLELLIELGLGIDRRLREARAQQRLPRLAEEEVSFWYLANHLGSRFLRAAGRKLESLEAIGPGLWRSRMLGRLVLLVSSIDLPVEEDSLPLHIVGQEPAATEREVARLVLQHPKLQERYEAWLAHLHTAAWKEVEAMARTGAKGPPMDLRPVIEIVGLRSVIDQIGLDRVIDEVGLDRVIDEVGKKEVIKRIGLEGILASLSAAERRELKRRLQ